MKIIKDSSMVIEKDKYIFHEKLLNDIYTLQEMGEEVEIQYSLDKGIYSALILGRVEE
jgi:hypothetical protein